MAAVSPEVLRFSGGVLPASLAEAIECWSSSGTVDGMCLVEALIELVASKDTAGPGYRLGFRSYLELSLWSLGRGIAELRARRRRAAREALGEAIYYAEGLLSIATPLSRMLTGECRGIAERLAEGVSGAAEAWRKERLGRAAHQLSEALAAGVRLLDCL